MRASVVVLVVLGLLAVNPIIAVVGSIAFAPLLAKWGHSTVAVVLVAITIVPTAAVYLLL